MYILIWLFLAILGVIIITFNFLENNTTNKNDKNFFKKFIPDIENSFYNVQATWTDIIFIHLSILTLMRFLLDLFSDSINYFPQLNTYFGSFSSVLFASIHFLLYLLLWYLFVASGGKLAYTLGRRKKHTAKGEVDSFSNCCAFLVVSIYMVLLIIFMLV